MVGEQTIEVSAHVELEGPLLTIHQVAQILSVHPNTLRAWTNKGLIKALRVGRRGDRRFLPVEVKRFLIEAGYKVSY